MRLIDKHELLSEWDEKCSRECSVCEYYDSIGDTCVVIENAKVVNPVKHGSWLIRNTHVACSMCDHRLYVEDYGFVSEISAPNWAYCPMCGAKMDLE